MLFSKKKKQNKKETKESKNRELISECLSKGYIHCRVIIEMMGAPKEHLVKSLKGYIERIKTTNKDIIVINEYYARPKKHEKLFSTYVELELLVKNASALAFFCFDYMPSSIEIIEPEIFTYKAADFAAFFNDMQARLHKLDMAIKTYKATIKNLETNAKLLLRNNILINLRERDKDLAELSRNTGIPENQLGPFLSKMIEEGWLKIVDDKYSLRKKF
ncbi:MAG: hypothetical protein N3D84_01115 [Candidatus Woesearchaeota archaeon]|nr:hypothetical protein [Candidatus Woesearchaeota archaeon]